jgi:DNA-binding GntR family transcriptional regulator
VAEVDLTGLTLERTSTAQQVANAIRDQLLRGEIAPGARLRDEAIAATLSVSRNTVREAMQILASEGLVRRSLHRGAVVSELNAKDLADVYQARRVIEIAGIRAVRSPTSINLLKEILGDMRQAVALNSLPQLLEADVRYHEAIVAALRSQRVSQFYRHVQTEIRLTRAWNGERPAPDVFYARHKDVVDALEAGDFARAESLVATLIDDGEARLLHNAATRGGRVSAGGVAPVAPDSLSGIPQPER